MRHAKAPRRERSFGLSVGGVMTMLALVLAWRGRIVRAEVLGAIGVTLIVLGSQRPAWLKVPSEIWWALAGALGWFNTRLLLSLAFFLVLTPSGVFRRLSGRDPMARRRAQFKGWTPSPERYRDPQHFKRMF
jgi:hypothetical protein